MGINLVSAPTDFRGAGKYNLGMSITIQSPAPLTKPIVYPESDGLPMAENTLQFRWIVTIKGNLDLVYCEVVDVFVAGDLLWYPVEGDPTIRQAPDVFVAFGRPKGERGSYRQWEEEGIAPQVVFEILSPGNRPGELLRKFVFYEKYGVEEYYLHDPQTGEVWGFLRDPHRLAEIPNMNGWVSPRLQCRFETINDELVMTGPDGRRFLTFVELGVRAKELEDRNKDLEERNQDLEERSQEADRKAEKLREQLRKLGAHPDA